eukprot:353710-Chlamydomonas_euryale.AAC.5
MMRAATAPADTVNQQQHRLTLSIRNTSCVTETGGHEQRQKCGVTVPAVKSSGEKVVQQLLAVTERKDGIAASCGIVAPRHPISGSMALRR